MMKNLKEQEIAMNIEPLGYLKRFLEKQMDGLTGHIGEAGYPFDCVEWGAPDDSPATTNDQWWRYEQVAYWLDGYTRAAILLKDEEKIANASRIIYNVIHHPRGTYLGPEVIADPEPLNFRWPHVVFFRACIALYDYNGDRRIPEAIRQHYLGDSADYAVRRNVMNVEIMLRVYEITKDEALLRLAVESYDRYNDTCTDDACDRVALSPKKPYVHGVTYNEYGKLGAILYRATGEERYLRASERAFAKAVKMFMLPGGCLCSNEYLLSDHYYNSTETCNVSDFTWALSYLLQITKKTKYADLIERCVFNAGMGAITEDFRALQYFSCANQVIADHQSNHNIFSKGKAWMRFAPNPGTECCPGNVNRFMPNYVMNMWGEEAEGIYCYLYGSGRFSSVRGGKSILIEEETNYPATDVVRFSIQTETTFDFYYRVPLFMSRARVTVNGESMEKAPKKGYHCLRIEGNTEVEIVFEAETVAHRKKGRVYFTHGALTYSLCMKGERQTELPEGKRFPNYNMYPDRPWQYAILKGEATYHPSEQFEEYRLGDPLPYLTVHARRIKNYDLDRVKRFYFQGDVKFGRKHYVDEPHIFTPKLLSNDQLQLSDHVESIRLYPYGAGKLRMTVFNEVDE